MRYMADTVALARKDLLLELRGRETVPAMTAFVVSALVLFRFALTDERTEAANGLLWVALLFTALLALTRAFAAERDQGLLDALVLAPCDRSAIWLGKLLATLVFLGLVEAVALPAFSIFFEPVDAATVAAVVLADVGLCAAGTLLAAMVVGGRARELLLPVLFLPVTLPVLIGGVGTSVADDPGRYLAFLALYDAIFAILAWAAFEYVVTE
jgi:heme exporter protein B